MQSLLISRSRGQALLESALALPVFLLAMFAVVWALKAGVVGERVQQVARYAGMVSAQISPYDQYSFYATYQAAAGSPLIAPCVAPPAALLSDGAPLQAPAVATQPFWQPSSSAVAAPNCGRIVASAGASGPVLLSHAQFAVSATSDVPPFVQKWLGSATSWSAAHNQLESPDMSSLIVCYPELQSAFAASAAPATTYGAPAAVQALSFPTNALALSSSCGG